MIKNGIVLVLENPELKWNGRSERRLSFIYTFSLALLHMICVCNVKSYQESKMKLLRNAMINGPCQARFNKAVSAQKLAFKYY